MFVTNFLQILFQIAQFIILNYNLYFNVIHYIEILEILN